MVGANGQREHLKQNCYGLSWLFPTAADHIAKGSNCAKVKVDQSCLTLYDPMDCSPPGSSVHGILQARILEWVAIPFSRGSSNPGIEPRFLPSDSLPSELREGLNPHVL